MKRATFDQMPCPIARSLERVGEWWNILILRDAFYGLSRFDEFQASLGIATSTLARRLEALVASGLLERRRYCEKPPRDEYVLTSMGRDFRPVMLMLLDWGNRHFAPEGPSVELVDHTTGAPCDPVLVDRLTGRPIAEARLVATPIAGPSMRRRIEGMASITKAAITKASSTKASSTKASDGRGPITTNPRTGRPITESHLATGPATPDRPDRHREPAGTIRHPADDERGLAPRGRRSSARKDG